MRSQLADLDHVIESMEEYGEPDFASSLALQSARRHRSELRRSTRSKLLANTDTPSLLLLVGCYVTLVLAGIGAWYILRVVWTWLGG